MSRFTGNLGLMFSYLALFLVDLGALGWKKVVSGRWGRGHRTFEKWVSALLVSRHWFSWRCSDVRLLQFTESLRFPSAFHPHAA
jgi:hypothetical protein